MSEKQKIILQDNHKRSLSVTARHIESSINDIEELLTNKRRDTITEKIVKNITMEKRDQILKVINIIREKNQKMFYELGLNSSVFYEDRIVQSRIGHIWTLLCDSTSKSLIGYGEVPLNHVEIIDSNVNDLLETINLIQDIMQQ
jgi:hypothetical protein